MNLNIRPEKPKDITGSKDEKWQEAEGRFKARKNDYTKKLDARYDKAKKHRNFALLAKQFEEGTLRRLGFKKDSKFDNIILPYVNHAANVSLQQDYYGNVIPNGGGTTLVEADAMSQILRGLQRVGGCNQIYNYAARDQLTAGIAFAQVVLDYANPEGGQEKTVDYRYLEDFWNVYYEPHAKKSTLSDSRCWMIRETVYKDEWEEKTGQSLDDWNSIEESKEVWQYWEREDEEETEYTLNDGSSEKLDPEEVGEDPSLFDVQMDDSGAVSRKVCSQSWCWYKIVDDKIIDSVDWKGEYSPIVAWTGERVVTDDDVYYIPLSAAAEEAQQMYTIIKHIQKMRLNKSPFSRYKVAFDAIMQSQLEDYIRASNTGDNEAIMWYASYTQDGKPLPPPEELPAALVDPLLQGMLEFQVKTVQRVLGIFDAALGQKSNEASGVAIQNRAIQSDLSTFHYRFNQMESIKQVALVTVDLVTKYMTAPQEVMLIDRDDNAAIQWINQLNAQGPFSKQMVAFREEMKFDLVIEAGPTNDTARKEEAEFLVSAIQKAPMLAQNPKIMAIVLRSQPGRLTQKAADVLEQGPDPQMQQAQAEMQKLQQANTELSQKLQAIGTDKSLEAEKQKNEHDQAMLKLRIDAINAEANYFKATGKLIGVVPTLPPEIAGAEGQIYGADSVAAPGGNTPRFRTSPPSVVPAFPPLGEPSGL